MMTQTHNMWLWQIVLAENRKMVKQCTTKQIEWYAQVLKIRMYHTFENKHVLIRS